ncbi:hypothetical protein J1N35_036464 [Gossypium stocksii]|uniref:Uncharacterized protein n=1 Tax=Gossypium stocksii TaxID=47602 RepID=A0A9D3ZL00_9ROSI|nr:hypothetical protein J1N35_036464 [Gossypium stocksii]
MQNNHVISNGRKIQEAVVSKLSYKSTLIGSSTTSDSYQKLEDFVAQEGDVKTEMVDGIPSITFSDGVEKFIERKMGNTIIYLDTAMSPHND